VETEWIEEARRARERAYAPYSNFAVGAVLVARDGRTFTGCNVENVSYGLTICAERVAVGKAIDAGVREFHAIVLATDSTEPACPCGACRQVLAEFAPALEILSVTIAGEQRRSSLAELLPRPMAGILDKP